MAFLDGFEEGIYDFVKKYFKAFFDKYKFEVFDKKVGNGMGALVIYSNPDILLKIVNDKSQFFVSIAGKEDSLFWDLDLIMAYFKIVDYRIDVEDKSSRKRVLLESFKWDNYSGMANLLNSNYNRVKSIFLPAKYESTKNELQDLKSEAQQYRLENWNN